MLPISGDGSKGPPEERAETRALTCAWERVAPPARPGAGGARREIPQAARKRFHSLMKSVIWRGQIIQ